MPTEKTQSAANRTSKRKEVPPQSAGPRSFCGDRKKLASVIVGVVLVVGVVYVVGYTLVQGHHPWASEAVRAQADVEAVLSQVAKKMLLPAGEPIMATVDDADVLREQQAFFQNAENGDQLLIFPESAQAVLYSPARGVVVNVGPIQYGDGILGSPAAGEEVTPTGGG